MTILASINKNYGRAKLIRQRLTKCQKCRRSKSRSYGMVDLAFLLITFFMLTTTLAKQNAMDLAMPVGEASLPISAARTMTICIGSNNEMLWYMGMREERLGRTEINDRRGLRKSLLLNAESVRKKTGKGLIVLVKPSDKSRYGDLVGLLDELKVTQVPAYSIVDIAKEDIDLLKSNGIY